MRIFFFVVVGLILVLSAWGSVSRYNECREHGFSYFYCLTSR